MTIIDKRGRIISLWEKTRGLLIFCACVFGIGVALRRFMYNCGFKKKTRLKARVISVGNITLGGTGKTPLVEYIARKLKENNKKVAVLSRGYGGGDEVKLFSKRNKDIPVLVGPNRAETGKEAVSTLGAEVIVLDDGFQHWSLERDVDIVTLNSTLLVWEDRLLPAGTLREKTDSLKRAKVFVLTRVSPDSKINLWLEFLKSINPNTPVFLTCHRPLGFINSSGESSPLNLIKDKDIIAFSGIAGPEAFEETLKGLGARLVYSIRYPDHYYYNSGDLQEIVKIAGESPFIITTEKDLVRIKGDKLDNRLFALAVELEFLKNSDRHHFSELIGAS
ncbi:MAG: tetraacyldisaccharide 4'-kinase [Candidatus Omnitrophica bacterium]|nr:tetraacyldisaccharide 4'-kinase [Candidatus Omnitrophota bacterium]